MKIARSVLGVLLFIGALGAHSTAKAADGIILQAGIYSGQLLRSEISSDT
jgi:hypothetical protein